jgi:integrase
MRQKSKRRRAGSMDGPIPEFGLSGGQLFDFRDNVPTVVKEAEAALGKGDIAHISIQLDELLDTFQINLDRKSTAYRELGLEVLRAHVRGLRAIQQRVAGEPIETPPLPAPNATPAIEQVRTTLSSAFESWKRARNRSPRTVQEYEYAIKLFGQLHGDMALAAIRKTQVRQFRENLQDVPTKPFRTGKLLRSTLPELAAWGREHPDAPKIGAGTINKLLGALQSIGRWARKEGIVHEEWADPFADMRLDEDESSRAPFEVRELQAIFTTAVFTKDERPKGGQGEAACWLPLLALFGGERLSELTGLRVSDVAPNELIGAVAIYINEDRKAGRRLKTKQSERFIPVHPLLIELGFLDFVARRVALMRGCFRLQRREPKGPQHTQSGSGATLVHMELLTPPRCFIPSGTRSSTRSALQTLATKSNMRCLDGAAEVFQQSMARRTKPHGSDTGWPRRLQA